MFNSLLIANRGEIACRVIRTARQLGIRTIAVYSDADAEALHVEQADEALRLGPAQAAQSYLNQAALLEAIASSGAEAVHPGYGFLSENADFAAAVAAAGAAFVGPPQAAVRVMGSKIEAKRLVADAGAPVVPGYNGGDQSAETLAAEAARIGYPVLVKAAMGGGGKGMRSVARPEDFAPALAGAKREAAAAFGDDAVLLERHLQAPKHIEIQILADAAGNTLSLHERDCSVQRRHQKAIEEAPAPIFGTELRQAMGDAAVRIARAVGYVGAGTVEFMVEDGAFYFLEMNTRLQVEHPVTEAILGLDLVEWQLRIAAGEPLPFEQRDLTINGHAVEARLYAENAKRGFLPSTGTLHRVSFPATLRVDSGVSEGAEVSVFYDAMLAKLIAYGVDRSQAMAGLRHALQATEIAGVEHNIAWLLRILDHPQFISGTHTTNFAEQCATELEPTEDPLATAAALVGTVLRRHGDGPWQRLDGFQANLPHEQTVRFRQGGKRLEARLVSTDGGFRVVGAGDEVRLEEAQLNGDLLFARCNGRRIRVRVIQRGKDIFAIHAGATERLTLIEPDASALGQAAESGARIVAPMPGRIVSIAVAAGDKVQPGQIVVVLEAMKMEHNIRAPDEGRVTAIHCAAGGRVDEGAELIGIEPVG